MLFIELITLSFKIRFNIINNNRLLLLTAPLFIGVIEAVADSITHTWHRQAIIFVPATFEISSTWVFGRGIYNYYELVNITS